MHPEQRLGSQLDRQGCRFRVWAPHAQQVRVLLQTGSHWRGAERALSYPLSRSADGYFSGHVPGVVAGMLYRYELVCDGQRFERIDPAARGLLESLLTRGAVEGENAAVVVDHPPYPWVDFVPPKFENYNLYQLHVGSFAGRHDHLNKSFATLADVETKFAYIRGMGFNAIAPLGVMQFAPDGSWGQNPIAHFAPENAYGSPQDLRRFVNAAHAAGLAVVFDVVQHQASHEECLLRDFDGYDHEGGIYFEGGEVTAWGRGPAWWKHEVQDLFYQQARMLLDEFHADGLRVVSTVSINGSYLRDVVWKLRQDFPDRYLIAEHLPAHPWIVNTGNFHAVWNAESHHQTQRALVGDNSVGRVLDVLQRGAFEHAWNLVNFTLGSHDDIGDAHNGNTDEGLMNWDRRRRYLVDLLGGRHHPPARAKCRLAWALCATMPGTPMCFMGSECLLASPHVAWGYWHDGIDQWGDHRFDWSIAGDGLGTQMRQLVTAANELRWQHSALRSDHCRILHADRDAGTLAFVRESDGDVVLVVMRLADDDLRPTACTFHTGCAGGKWRCVLATDEPRFGGNGTSAGTVIADDAGRLHCELTGWSLQAFVQG